jgi:SPP1 gp7 family putative phage head morphogenesis protein
MTSPTHEAAEATAQKNAREFKRVFGLKVRELEPGITERINRFRTDNVSKIKSLQGDQIQEIRNILDVGLEQGKHANTLRAEIQERFQVTRSKADLLARDQVLKLNAAITKDRQTRAGVTKYTWITARDERTRGNPSGLYPEENGSGNHWQLHGKVFSWSDPPIVEEKTGRRAHPGEDFQCRCVAVPVIEELSAEDEALFEEATAPEPVAAPATVAPVAQQEVFRQPVPLDWPWKPVGCLSLACFSYLSRPRKPA